MTTSPGDLSGFPGAEALGDIYCVSFVRNLAPEEVLRRFGVDEETMEEVTFDDLDERSAESMREDAAGYVGATKVGDWAVIVEPGGWQVAVDEDIYARVSRGTEVVSVCRHDYASDTFAYIVDGTPVACFDPMVPDARWGSDPDRFAEEMRELGLGPAHDIDHQIERSFALAGRITGLTLSPDILRLPFLGAEALED